MKEILQNIAEVQFGTSVKKAKDGQVICFQVNDIEENGSLKWETLIYADKSQIEESEFLRPRDVLLPAKGTRYTPVVVTKDFMPAVASSSLFVIRINHEKVLAQYLQCFLNLPRIQWDLAKIATGTNIPSLSIRDLRNFKIAIPDLETQRKITKLRSLQDREAEIVNQINYQRKKLVDAISKKMITKEMNQ